MALFANRSVGFVQWGLQCGLGFSLIAQ